MPNEALLKVISEIDDVAVNWDNTKKECMKLPGQDIQVNDIDMFQRLLHLNDFRSFLMNDANFHCRQCSLFREHVSRSSFHKLIKSFKDECLFFGNRITSLFLSRFLEFFDFSFLNILSGFIRS